MSTTSTLSVLSPQMQKNVQSVQVENNMPSIRSICNFLRHVAVPCCLLQISPNHAWSSPVSDVSASEDKSTLSSAIFMYGFLLTVRSVPILKGATFSAFLLFLLAVIAGLVAARRYMGASSSHEMNPPAVVQPLKEHTATVSDSEC